MSIDRKEFENPAKKYRVNPMMHNWPKDKNAREELMDAVAVFGYGGVVTNPAHENGYTQNPQNISEFGEIIKELEKRGLSFWIYDENGYPSGYANGMALKGHPELEAKGFYMRRRIAYEPRHSVFNLDDESDKIIWAAKYPVDCTALNDSILQYEKMEPVPFSDTFCECDLKENEAFFIFCVKPAYEGSHCTHNVCSHSRYINIMDPRAVRRFLDLCYEPVARQIPDAFSRAAAVFTDEPSLQNGYILGYETWPYALAPWVDGLFEEFEKEYGSSLLPWLPLLFEGQANAYPIRIKFYNLVGKLIASAFSGQIAAWCEAHGGKFSGHYLGEESILAHVNYYGSNVEVMKAANYPGIDVLACYPEIYNYNTAKHAQMVVRKKGTNGMMVEICPFIDVPTFAKNPIENMTGVIGLLYLGGCRVTNSYFASDFRSYNPEKLGAFKGYLNQKQANQFNCYVGRLGYILDNIQNDCNTYVYYALEDVQAKMKPQHGAISSRSSETDASAISITRKIYEAGYDFCYADREDFIKAAAGLKEGEPMISGCLVKTIIVPAVDVMYGDAYAALIELKKAGVKVLFLDKLPKYDTDHMAEFKKYDFREEAIYQNPVQSDEYFTPATEDEILVTMAVQDDVFTADANGVMLIKARYNKDGTEIYFIDNNSRSAAEVMLNHKEKAEATVWNPVDGSLMPVRMGGTVNIPSFRGIFVVFDR